MDLRVYLSELDTAFEQGIRIGVFKGIERVGLNCRLSKEYFGQAYGCEIDSDLVFVVDVYGLKRKSRGFVTWVEEVRVEFGKQMRVVECPVVHFASVRVEDILKLNPALVGKFPLVKKILLEARGFKEV